MQLVDMALSGKYDRPFFKSILSKKGGMMAHLGTHDAMEVHDRIAAGDTHAHDVFDAMSYSVAKTITGLIPAFDGFKPDQIILTGGLGRDDVLVGNITRMVAPLGIGITVIPGERELKGLRDGAIRVLNGEETAKVYKGKVL
jgi:butyrate kinase